MAAPAFSSATAQGSATATTTATVTLPTTAANDILILSAVNAGATAAPTLTTGTFTLDTSWTLIDSGTWTTGYGACWWVRCSGNHSGQTQIVSGTTDSVSCQVIRITGAITTGSPIDTASVTGATLGAVAGGALTGVSTTALETLVCYLGAVDDDQTATSPTKNAVAMSNLSTSTSTGGADSRVWYANSSQAVAGTTGNFAITNAAGTAQGKRVSSFAVLSVRQVVLETASGLSSATLSLKTPTYITGPSYKAGVLAREPSLYWPLDSGDAANDQSPNNRDGSGQGSISIGGFSGSPISGETTSTDFDDADDIVTTTYVPYVNGTARTYMGWAYRDTNTGVDTIFGTASGGQTHFVVYNATDWFFSANNVDFGTLGTWPGLGQWVHWALVFDESANTVVVYFNGSMYGSPFTHTDAYGATTALHLGAMATTEHWDGKMAHFAIFERALTATEVASLAQPRPPLVSSGLSSATCAVTIPSIAPEIPLDPASGQSSATLQVSKIVPLAAAANQSSATLTLTAPARLSLTVSGVSSATLTLKAPTRVLLDPANCVSSATLALTAKPTIVLAPAACVSSATLNLAQYVPFGSAVCISSATLTLTATARLSLTVSGQSSATLALTAPTRLTLTASSVASATLSLTALTRITLSPASCISSATLKLAQYIPLGTAACVSSATLALTAPAKVILGTASCQSSATFAVFAPGGGIVPCNAASGVSSATLILKAPTQVPLGAASGASSASLALKAQARVLLASSDGTSAATLLLTALTQIPFAPVFALSDGSLVVTVPSVAVEIPLVSADGLSSATLVVTAPFVAPPEPETFEFTIRRILTQYPTGTTVGVYEGEPDVYDNYGMRRLPPVEPVQTLTVESDPFTISDLTEGNYFAIGSYQRAVRPRGDPDFETVMQTISFRVP